MGIVNSDSGPLGALVATQLERSTSVSASELTEQEADARLKSGGIAGYVELPSDFSSSALQSHVVAPQIHLEGSQPGLSQSILQAVTQSFAAVAARPPGGAPPL